MRLGEVWMTVAPHLSLVLTWSPQSQGQGPSGEPPWILTSLAAPPPQSVLFLSSPLVTQTEIRSNTELELHTATLLIATGLGNSYQVVKSVIISLLAGSSVSMYLC